LIIVSLLFLEFSPDLCELLEVGLFAEQSAYLVALAEFNGNRGSVRVKPLRMTPDAKQLSE
jgi:hypothetical protein